MNQSVALYLGVFGAYIAAVLGVQFKNLATQVFGGIAFGFTLTELLLQALR